MNYIEEINAFRTWIYHNSPSSGQIALWFALMDVANKTYWKEWFTSANATLMLGSGLSRQGVVNARAFLKENGIIDFKENGQNKAASYHMISFSTSKKLDIPVYIPIDNKESTSKKLDIPLALDLPINKLNETKEITTTTETVSDIHTKVFGTMFMNGLMSDYINDLKRRGYQDTFIMELMLETGESGNKPSLRLMQTIGERWIKDRIYTRVESKRRKDEEKSKVVSFQTNKPQSYQKAVGQVVVDNIDETKQYLLEVQKMKDDHKQWLLKKEKANE